MLIGAYIFYDILRTGQFKPEIYKPVFQETALGWIVSSPSKIYVLYEILTHFAHNTCQTNIPR